MGLLLQILGLEKSNAEKAWDRRDEELERQKDEYPNKKQEVLKRKKVLSITFQCLNCGKKWVFKYPSGIDIGYGCFGSGKHGWVRDNFSRAGHLYNYDCPNCGGNDIEIIKRNPIK